MNNSYDLLNTREDFSRYSFRSESLDMICAYISDNENDDDNDNESECELDIVLQPCKNFDYFFPENIYKPLDTMSNLNVIPEPIVFRVYEGSQLSTAIYMSYPISKAPSISFPQSKLSMMGVIVPPETVVQAFNMNNTDICTFIGPSKYIFPIPEDKSLANISIRQIDPPVDMFVNLNNELLLTQKMMAIRVYHKPNFNHYKFNLDEYMDIYVGSTTSIEGQSLIIPYGLTLENDQTIIEGPCFINNFTSIPSLYVKGTLIRHPIRIDRKSESTLINSVYPNINLVKKQLLKDCYSISAKDEFNISISHLLHTNLRPLLGYYIVSDFFGDEITQALQESSSWEINSNTVIQIVLYWLKKTQGNYTYIIDMLKNPTYTETVKKAMVIYARTGMKANINQQQQTNLVQDRRHHQHPQHRHQYHHPQ